MKKPDLSIAHTLSKTRVNGPGLRYTIWFQGCSLGCQECINQDTHPFSVKNRSVTSLIDDIGEVLDDIEGVTLSGGEPFQQLKGMQGLVCRLKQTYPQLSLLCFSGYSYVELLKMPGSGAVLDNLDVLIAGRFNPKLRQGNNMLGSSNQTIHLLSTRYQLSDLASVPDIELHLEADGSLVATGIGVGISRFNLSGSA